MTSKEALYDRIQEEYAEAIAGHPNPSMTPWEYRGLYGTVVANDCYRLRQLDFVPEVIFDIGGNIGVFTRFARELFPQARIIAVEPGKRNFENLLLLTPERADMVLLNKAIGQGQLWTSVSAKNGAHEAYLSETKYLTGEWFRCRSQFVCCDVESVMLDSLAAEHLGGKERVFVKIDCEGAEAVIFEHEPSMAVLAGADAFAIEIHGMNRTTAEAFCRFSQTHNLEMDSNSPLLYARKKQ